MYNFLFEGVLDENNTLLNYPKNTRVWSSTQRKPKSNR
jgi:hypothetical protein